MVTPALQPELQQRLPSPSGVALAILNAFRNEDVSITEIADLVMTDPALSGRLIERANAATAGSRPVVSVAQAVNRLGMQTVRQLALSFSLIDQYASGSCAEFDYSRFWSHSLLVGVAMKELGAHLKLGGADELFTCGLLARVGSLALATAYPKEYGKVLAANRSGAELVSLEREQLHTDHMHLADVLLCKWGIPKIYNEPVLYHEAPGKSPFLKDTRLWQLCHVLHLASRVADLALEPQAQASLQISRLTEAASLVGINATELEYHVDTAVHEWRALGEQLKIKSSAVPTFGQMKLGSVRPDQESDPQWLRVLVATHDASVLAPMVAWLKDEGHYTVKTATSGSEALALAVDFKPHVVITERELAGMDGIALCSALRASDWGQNIYVLMLTRDRDELVLVHAFDAGVDDFIVQPVTTRVLGVRLKAAWRYVRLRDAWERDHERLSNLAAELALSNRKLQTAALTDPLTDLFNRRAGLTAMTQAWSAAERRGHALTLISLDVDNFKAINDEYGHAMGDTVLQQIGQRLRAAARKEDAVCRWGGEEFLVVSPNILLGEGVLAAERLRKDIAAMPVLVSGKPLRVTVSVGLASRDAESNTQDQLLINVDKALYAAKRGGRNRLAVFSHGHIQLLNPN